MKKKKNYFTVFILFLILSIFYVLNPNFFYTNLSDELNKLLGSDIFNFDNDFINLNNNYKNQELINESINIDKKLPKFLLNLYDNNNVWNNYKITNYSIYFCPGKKCYSSFVKIFNDSKHSIICAFYEFDEDNLSKILLTKSNNVNISFIVDDKYLEEKPLQKLYGHIDIFSDVDRNTRYNNYMHDKFCVIDNEIVLTGSTNPTYNGIFRNNNNLIIINSSKLANYYTKEFIQMRENYFGYNKKSFNKTQVLFEGNNSNYIISFFCPEDKCEKEVAKYLSLANKSIYFASFVFTDDLLSGILINKSKHINVSGVIEKRNINVKGSDFKKMNSSFNFYLDHNKYNMHNKYFIIDGEYVITGSANPSKSGYFYNDENILIIKNKNIAKEYLNNYKKLVN